MKIPKKRTSVIGLTAGPLILERYVPRATFFYEGTMFAAFIFFMLMATLASAAAAKRHISLTLFVVCWVLIAILFNHHVTEALDISL